MKGLMLLADGFEDSEALATRDVLLRSGLIIVTASIKNDLAIKSSFQIELKADIKLSEVNLEEFDFLVIPGGGRGVKELASSPMVSKVIKYFFGKNLLIAAICAAPSLLGKMGILDNKNYTCFPGYEFGLGHKIEDVGVVVDGHLITARSVFFSFEFGLEIINFLLGKDTSNKVKDSMKAKL